MMNIGDKMPCFEAFDSGGNLVTERTFEGRPVIVYFYPRDLTPGCTAEACNLNQGRESLKNLGYDIVGVSPDSSASHQKFGAKYNLGFMLLSDVEKTVIKAFGAWGEKKMYGKTYEGVLRITYIFDAKSSVSHIIEKVDTKNHTEQILKLIGK